MKRNNAEGALKKHRNCGITNGRIQLLIGFPINKDRFSSKLKRNYLGRNNRDYLATMQTKI